MIIHACLPASHIANHPFNTKSMSDDLAHQGSVSVESVITYQLVELVVRLTLDRKKLRTLGRLLLPTWTDAPTLRLLKRTSISGKLRPTLQTVCGSGTMCTPLSSAMYSSHSVVCHSTHTSDQGPSPNSQSNASTTPLQPQASVASAGPTVMQLPTWCTQLPKRCTELRPVNPHRSMRWRMRLSSTALS